MGRRAACIPHCLQVICGLSGIHDRKCYAIMLFVTCSAHIADKMQKHNHATPDGRCSRARYTWHSEQQRLSLSICLVHLLWSKSFLDKHSCMRQASVLQGSFSLLLAHPNIFMGPHPSGVPVSFPMVAVTYMIVGAEGGC